MVNKRYLLGIILSLFGGYNAIEGLTYLPGFEGQSHHDTHPGRSRGNTKSMRNGHHKKPHGKRKRGRRRGHRKQYVHPAPPAHGGWSGAGYSGSPWSPWITPWKPNRSPVEFNTPWVDYSGRGYSSPWVDYSGRSRPSPWIQEWNPRRPVFDTPFVRHWRPNQINFGSPWVRY